MTQPLELRHSQVGPWPMNTYALFCPNTGQSVLFDPGADPDTLTEMLAGSRPIAILLTHTHGDHVGALEEMRQRLNVPIVAHANAQAKGFAIDQTLTDGDTFAVGHHALRVAYAPGHIDDQICFSIVGDHRVVVGDTIFAGGPGKTWSADGFRTTLKTLQSVVLPWPDDTVCYPGHGPHFRLGDIRAQVEAFVQKEHGEFFGDAEWGM
ncbi:MAG: MBL fold metallo-hydrolase [Caldilineaceae bacterium]|nr:MBL fold metallo-hydrolase [Caldilineaceae bacterium]MCB9155986.1 MBL fold metallo-hydrolase [Caldilineaceae bacterium]